MTTRELGRPGRAREAAVEAIARELHMGLGICRDRADALARKVLDAGLKAAEAQ